MTRWWEAEGQEMYMNERVNGDGGFRILDMAAGR